MVNSPMYARDRTQLIMMHRERGEIPRLNPKKRPMTYLCAEPSNLAATMKLEESGNTRKKPCAILHFCAYMSTSEMVKPALASMTNF